MFTAADLLHPDTLSAVQAELVATLDSPSGLDDAQRVDAIRALERLACTATAAQALLSAEFAESMTDEQERRGVPAAERGRGVAHQVAHARRESPHRGRQHLGLARVVRTELPHTWDAWRQGRISEWKATLVARETACLSLAERLAVDAAVAGDADRLEAMGDRQLGLTVAAEAARIDPAAVVARRRRAEADRHVTLRPAPDTMTWFGALLPARDGVALFATLSRAADAVRSAGDPRSRGQVMADELVARATGPSDQSSPGTPQISLGLVMSEAALVSGAEDTAHLDGYGPIPAELARELVADTLSADERIAVRRLWARPDTGQLVAMDSRSRLFRGSLARFIQLRDRVCRTPWCDAPIRHIDHVVDHADGGPTSEVNAQGLCEACNYAKQAPSWRAGPGPDGMIETFLPTGHHYLTRPPPLMTVHQQPVRVDFVLCS